MCMIGMLCWDFEGSGKVGGHDNMNDFGNFRMGLSQAISHWGKYYGNKGAIISDNKIINYNDLDKFAESWAQSIYGNIGSNNRVAICQTDSICFFVSLVSILRSNNVACIINAELPVEKIQLCAEDCDAKLILMDEETTKSRPSILNMVDIPKRIVSPSEKDVNPVKASWPLPKPYDDWGIVYTSGTTSSPKGVILSHMAIFSELMGWFIELEMTKKTRLYVSVPPYYTAGLVLASTTLMTGGTLVNFRCHSPERYASYLEKSMVNISYLSPGELQELVSYFKSHTPLPHIGDKILILGEPVPFGLKKEARDILSVDIIESWGNSEGLGTITESEDVEIRPNSIGRPFLCDENFILDEYNNVLPDNEIGRIAGKTNCCFSGYNGRDDLNSQYIIGDSILSDDFGSRDKEGYFYIKDRINYSFLTNGERIYSLEIEREIQKLPCVEEVAVIGLESTKGTIPVALIRLRNDKIDTAKLVNRINESLSENQKIRNIKYVDKFPKSTVGKNLKNELKKLF